MLDSLTHHSSRITSHELRIADHASPMAHLQSRKEPIPAAAVAFVRDTGQDIEVYLSQRPLHFRYCPGAFVFPGGRRDPEDADLRATACREVMEEIGVEIDPLKLVPLRDIHTSPHAGPVYRMLTFAYEVSGEFITSLNREEIDQEIWLTTRDALVQLELPYQIKAAVFTISRFTRVVDLLRSLESGTDDEDYWF